MRSRRCTSTSRRLQRHSRSRPLRARPEAPINHLDFIQALLDEASRSALDPALGRRATSKAGDPNDLVTEIDRKVGEGVVRRIRESFPDHVIIEEESGVTGGGSPWTWVVDPIDGTSN